MLSLPATIQEEIGRLARLLDAICIPSCSEFVGETADTRAWWNVAKASTTNRVSGVMMSATN